MFARVFAKFLWDAYDYVGRLILANIIFCFIIAGLMGAIFTTLYPLYSLMQQSYVILALGIGIFSIIALPFPAAGFLYFISLINQDSEPEFRDFVKGLRLHYFSLMKLTALFVFLFELIALNIAFYINPRVIPPQLRMIATVIAGLCVWLSLYLIAMALYAYPLSVHQGVGAKKAFIRSFLLVMDNIGVTILTLILLTGICGLGIVTKGIMIFVLNLALSASLANSLYENVMEKYELQEAKKRLAADAPRPTSWKQIKTEDFIEDRHKRYKRTLKDILKPWEY